MTLRKIYIRHREGVPCNVNCYNAWYGFTMRGVEVAPFEGFGDIEKIEDLGPEVGIHGFVGDFQKAMEKLSLPMPEPLDYPDELEWCLGRGVYETTLGDIRNGVVSKFIKPKEQKLFCGRVWNGTRGDRITLATFPDRTPVWASDIVDFISEYRGFVLNGVLVGVKHYKGGWEYAPPSPTWWTAAILAYTPSAPTAYSLDFGVVLGGRPLLVEANDAFALGCYGLDSSLYCQMIEARWKELTSSLVSGKV